ALRAEAPGPRGVLRAGEGKVRIVVEIRVGREQMRAAFHDLRLSIAARLRTHRPSIPHIADTGDVVRPLVALRLDAERIGLVAERDGVLELGGNLRRIGGEGGKGGKEEEQRGNSHKESLMPNTAFSKYGAATPAACASRSRGTASRGCAARRTRTRGRR